MTETDTSRKAVERIFNQNYPRGYDNLREAEVIARVLLARAEKAEAAFEKLSYNLGTMTMERNEAQADARAAWNDAIHAAIHAVRGLDFEYTEPVLLALRDLLRKENDR